MYASKSFLEVPTEMSSVAGERGGGGAGQSYQGERDRERYRHSETDRQRLLPRPPGEMTLWLEFDERVSDSDMVMGGLGVPWHGLWIVSEHDRGTLAGCMEDNVI